MSDDPILDDDDNDDVPQVPSGYVPGTEVLAGQNVGDRGEVIPSPEEVLEKQRQAIENARQAGGAGSPNSPDTAAAGSEHEDR